MQGDGNFVVYRSDVWKPLWASGTDGHPGASVVMQDDGSLVVYDADGTYLWDSAPDGRPGAYVTMQDHGNLVVYTPDREAPWASDTVRISPLPSAPTLISLAPDRHEMFQQGIDAALMHRSFANGSWGDWASLGGEIRGRPAASFWSSGRIDLFVRSRS
jgi:hypothetical protein